MTLENKTIEIQNIRCSYFDEGEGDTLVLMHGWGQNKEMMALIAQYFLPNYRVVGLDFPGFGASDDPSEPWGVIEYTTFFKAFLDALHITKPVLIGHSFGCRVAIRFQAKYGEAQKMILTGAAGLKPKHSWDYYVRLYAYKLGKWTMLALGQKERLMRLQAKSGSSDYRNAKGVMKATFVKVVNDDVKPVLSKITCPTLLVWGDKDDAAPLWMGKVMEKQMKDATLVLFENDDHWAYYHQSDRFHRVCAYFLKGE